MTNVRKRIWQPIKKKNKNKGTKDLMLKVKMRLESEADSASSAGENCIRLPMEPVSALKLENHQNQSKIDMIAQTNKEFRHLPSPLNQANGLESI